VSATVQHKRPSSTCSTVVTGVNACRLIGSPATTMDSMAVLLEAAAEDIKLIDCLGPEDLCHDPNSADGLKPVRTLQLCSVTKTTLICSTTSTCCSSVIGSSFKLQLLVLLLSCSCCRYEALHHTQDCVHLQLHIHGLRPRSARAAAAGVAAVVQSVMESPPAPALYRRRPSPADPKAVAKEQVHLLHKLSMFSGLSIAC